MHDRSHQQASARKGTPVALDKSVEEDIEFIDELISDGRPLNAVARFIKALVDELVGQGFSREEAIQLTVAFGDAFTDK